MKMDGWSGPEVQGMRTGRRTRGRTRGRSGPVMYFVVMSILSARSGLINLSRRSVQLRIFFIFYHVDHFSYVDLFKHVMFSACRQAGQAGQAFRACMRANARAQCACMGCMASMRCMNED